MPRINRILASVCAMAALIGGVGATSAAAQPTQNGLVNVVIGPTTIEDVNVGVAAALAANVCNVKVGPIAVLAVQVDRSGNQSPTICTADAGPVFLTQD